MGKTKNADDGKSYSMVDQDFEKLTVTKGVRLWERDGLGGWERNILNSGCDDGQCALLELISRWDTMSSPVS